MTTSLTEAVCDASLDMVYPSTIPVLIRKAEDAGHVSAVRYLTGLQEDIAMLGMTQHLIHEELRALACQLAAEEA